MVSTILLCLYWLSGPHGRSGGTHTPMRDSLQSWERAWENNV